MSNRSTLRFGVELVRSSQDLLDACRVRQLAYGHHLSGMPGDWGEPEDIDRKPDTIVVLARDKSSGEAVGTMRINSNSGGPLLLEHSVRLPPQMREELLVEPTRFCVVPAYADPTVRLALMKALYLVCMDWGVQWLVMGARRDSLVRQYMRLGFTDIFQKPVEAPFAHAGGLLHRVLAFHVASAERNWRAISHPYFNFMILTQHEDIRVIADLREIRSLLVDQSQSVATTAERLRAVG